MTVGIGMGIKHCSEDDHIIRQLSGGLHMLNRKIRENPSPAPVIDGG